MATPGELLKKTRQARGYSQEALARSIDVSFSSVAQWETGRTTPRRARAAALDEVLGLNGQLMAAFGYVAPLTVGFDGELPAEISSLPARVDALEAQLSAVTPPGDDVAQLRARVEELEAAMAELAPALKLLLTDAVTKKRRAPAAKRAAH